MKVICSLLLAIVVLGCQPSGAPAECMIVSPTCAGTTSVGTTSVSMPPDACPLRTRGPFAKGDIEEASKLLAALTNAQESLREFRDAPASGQVSMSFSKESACLNCYPNSTGQLFIGKNEEVRDMISAWFKQRIEKLSCRLRALGVDVPRP
jgi:hypothetical protein